MKPCEEMILESMRQRLNPKKPRRPQRSLEPLKARVLKVLRNPKTHPLGILRSKLQLRLKVAASPLAATLRTMEREGLITITLTSRTLTRPSYLIQLTFKGDLS